MLTRELQQTINRAIQLALQRRHEYVTLEHLLYALLDDKTARTVIEHCGGHVVGLRRELEQFLAESFEMLPEGVEYTPDPTLTFERVLERAFLQAQGSGQTSLNGGNILVAMYQERHSHAVFLLEHQGVTKLDMLN